MSERGLGAVYGAGIQMGGTLDVGYEVIVGRATLDQFLDLGCFGLDQLEDDLSLVFCVGFTREFDLEYDESVGIGVEVKCDCVAAAIGLGDGQALDPRVFADD